MAVRQLVEVFWVDGLGPKGWVDEEDEEAAAATARVGGQAASGAQQVQKHLGHHTNHNSFADQVSRSCRAIGAALHSCGGVPWPGID